MSGEGEVSTGVEEQDIAAETVHDASPAPGPNVKRCQVRHFVAHSSCCPICACSFYVIIMP